MVGNVVGSDQTLPLGWMAWLVPANARYFYSMFFFFYNSHHWSWEVWSVTDMAGWVIIVPILARSCKRNLQYSQLIWKSKMEPSVAIFWSFKLLLFKKNYNFNIGRMFIFYMISSKFGCKLFFMWGKNHVKTQKLFFQTTSFGTPFLG